MNPADLSRARALLDRADRVLVLTGAGISAESGVPTFRGAEGLWKEFRPEELATPAAFRRDPRLVWEWYGWRRDQLAACRPNPGHRALARWLRHRGETVRLVTQNVDGLHALAMQEELQEPAGGHGAAAPAHGETRLEDGEAGREIPLHHPPGILELHGSIFRVRCTRCGQEWEDRNPVDAGHMDTLPRCRDCRGLLRPAVVWFGEMLPAGVLEASMDWARKADVALVVGTSALVHPAASLPLLTLEQGGQGAREGCIIEANPEPTPLTTLAEVCLRGPAGRVLPALLGDRQEPAAV